MLNQTKSILSESSLIFFLLFCLVFITATKAQPVVTSFTLINADDDTDIGTLNDGDTLILNLLPSINLNVRANTNPGSVDKVTFDLDGVLDYRSESSAPYALFGDKNGDYNEWTPSPGSHVVAAEARYNNVTGPKTAINFFVIAQVSVDCNGDINGFAYLDDCGVCAGGNSGVAPNLDKDTCGVCFGDDSSCASGCFTPTVTSLSLINSNNNSDLGVLSDGDTIDETQLLNFSIRANVCSFPTGSVKFIVDGNQFNIDNGDPFAINGNSNGFYNTWNADSGIHVITAVPYSLSNASGTPGNALSISLLIIDTGLVDTSNYGSFPNLVCNTFPGGRIALSFDGNLHDSDDYASLPMAMAMMYYAGHQDKLVHVEYNNHLGFTDSIQEYEMALSAREAASRWNYSSDILFNAIENPDSTSDALAAAINASSAASPLWILAGGPMETIARGMAKADSTKRQFVKIVTHSSFNNQHTHFGPPLYNDWYDLLADYTDDSTEFIELPSMNGGGAYDRFKGPRSYWRWLINDPDTNFHWLYARNKTTAFDCSDAGMTYWVLSGAGDTTAGVNEVRGLLESPCYAGCSCKCDSNKVGVATLTSPNDSDFFALGATVSIQVNIVDPDSNANYVEFYSNNVSIGIDSISNYMLDVSSLDTGYHSIYAKAIDSCGAVSYTDTIIIDIQNNDCAGLLGGSAYLDDCGICVGGTTGVLPNLDKDTCDVCFGDNLSCITIDCNEDTTGTAYIDSCGICADGNTGIVPNSACTDCAGVVNGSAFVDTCNVCVGGNTGVSPNSSCSDCNGIVYGTAFVDSCGVCSAGNTGVTPNSSCTDCNGVVNGLALTDSCGVCAGGTTGVAANACSDCNGDPFGTAAVDTCGVCAGGNTGIIPNTTCAPCVPNQVTQLVLMQAGTGGVALGNISNGDVIIKSVIGAFSIEALVCSDPDVESVVFNVNGSNVRTESVPAYALNGDKASTGFKAWNVPAGLYTVTATPYSGNSGNGTAGVAKTVTFTILDQAPATDCNGDAGGSASIDQCNVCSGGNTGLTPNASCTDCNGDVNGTASIDACNVCSGGNTGVVTDACIDCAGVLNGGASVDACGVCSGGTTTLVPDATCLDCNNVPNGGAVTDDCGDCVLGTTGLAFNSGCSIDCNGDINGLATIDACGVCAGGSTGITPDLSCTDCFGVINGTASVDACGVCSGGTTTLLPDASCSDCAGVANGSAALDTCGVCTGGTTGIAVNSTCGACVPNEVVSLVLMEAGLGGVALGDIQNGDVIIKSVVGTFSIEALVCSDPDVESVIFNVNGTNVRTESVPAYALNGDKASTGFKAWNVPAGVYTVTATPYSSNSGNGTAGVAKAVTFTILDQAPTSDCNGDAGGSASIDQCGDCTGGNTGVTPNTTCLDCNGDINGTASVDACGVCSGGNTGVTPDACIDCNGDLNGTAAVDACGVCAGGTTGNIPDASCLDCNNIPNGGAVTDDCGDCVLGTTGLAFNSGCSIDCNGDINGLATIDACGVCAGGSTGITPNVSCTDCFGVINGSASVDACGVCSGGTTTLVPDASCSDCAGVANGSAAVDTCGVCSGGTTGIAVNSTCGGGTCSPNEVTAMMLIDASSNLDIGALANGDTIDLSVLPNFSVRADVCSDPAVESLEFNLNGSNIRTENIAPYTVNGDNNGNYTPWPLTAGTYVLTGTPYSGNNKSGNVGIVKTITFHVTAGPPPPPVVDCHGVIGGTAYFDGCATCVGGTTGLLPCVPNAGCGEFIEVNGLVVVEMESVPVTNSNWYQGTGPVSGLNVPTPSGSYYMWRENCVSGSNPNYVYSSCGGTNSGNSGGANTYKISISTPGRYRLQIRSWQPNLKLGTHSASTENNDCWIQLPDGGGIKKKGSTEVNIGSSEWVKSYQNVTNGWSWNTSTVDGNPHQIFIDFPSAGTYTLNIAGRSKLFALDRFVLYRSGNASNNVSGSAATTSMPAESPRGTCGSADVAQGPDQTINGQQLGTNGDGQQAITSSLGVIDDVKAESFSVNAYPNPTTGKLNLAILPANTEATIELYDATGKLLLKIQQEGEANEIDLSPYANGLYWVKVHSDRAVRMQKVYKK